MANGRKTDKNEKKGERVVDDYNGAERKAKEYLWEGKALAILFIGTPFPSNRMLSAPSRNEIIESFDLLLLNIFREISNANVNHRAH